MDPAKFSFLKSPRFWQLAIVGLTAALEVYSQTNDPGKALLAALGIWLGGSVVVGTADRFGTKAVTPPDVAPPPV